MALFSPSTVNESRNVTCTVSPSISFQDAFQEMKVLYICHFILSGSFCPVGTMKPKPLFWIFLCPQHPAEALCTSAWWWWHLIRVPQSSLVTPSSQGCCCCSISKSCQLLRAHQAPLSMGFPRQEYWSGLPFPSPGNLLNLGTKPTHISCMGTWILSLWATWEAPSKVPESNLMIHTWYILPVHSMILA